MSNSPNRPSYDGIGGVLLDIEGTTSSISFVYDIMFPYARDHFEGYLEEHWESTAVESAIRMLATDVGFQSTADLFAGLSDQKSKQKTVVKHLIDLMDADVKATGLKKMQGLVWQSGFQSGEMVAHVYDDVFPAIKTWTDAGIDVRIYSSGSVHAQQLFFAHSVAGNLLSFFNGHYDTTTGAKTDPASYSAIVQEFSLPSDSILFVSDVTGELDAATASGMQVCLSVRPGNKPVESGHSYPAAHSFAEIAVN